MQLLHTDAPLVENVPTPHAMTVPLGDAAGHTYPATHALHDTAPAELN